MLAQEMVVSRSHELKLCRGSLAASTKEVEDVKSELAIALQDRDTSLSSVSSLKTELHAANKKLQDLQSQLEKSRAATAHVKLSASHSCYKKARHSSAVCDSRAGPTATCINAAKPLDVHVFVQQLEMSQKKLMKAVKVWPYALFVWSLRQAYYCFAQHCLYSGTGEVGTRVRAQTSSSAI